jgi:phosphate-selective porin OprO/OprP
MRHVRGWRRRVARQAVILTLAGSASVLQSATASADVQGGVDAQASPASRNTDAPPAASPLQSGEEGESIYDRIWKFAEWYESESNPVIQKLLFSGRFQQDFVTIGADQGDLNEWNVRRLRLGPRVTLFRRFLLHGEVELNPQERDPLYVRLTDAYLQWSKSGRAVVTVGKQGVPFTMDGATSSKDLLTIDRSNLSNNIWFPQEYMTGLSVSGRSAPWTYRVGVFSAGAMNREFGEFNGGVFTLAVIGYDLAHGLGAREALLTGNYLYQEPDPDNTFTRALRHVGSVSFKLDDGGWGFRGELAAASGYFGQSDLASVMAMPYLNITDKWQVVGRYTFVESRDPNGVRLATYESRVVDGRGNRYAEAYLGANYYFYGHKLKLQTGVQWADMNDRADDGGAYSGVSWTTGLRVGW